MNGISFTCVEVTSINRHGFWVQCGEEELYLPFVEFPWFEHATVAQICNVQSASAHRLYWPGLDLDLALDAIRNPLAVSHCGLNYDC